MKMVLREGWRECWIGGMRVIGVMMMGLMVLFRATGGEVRDGGGRGDDLAGVVSGFEAFGGRGENASMVLARSLAGGRSELELKEVPVVWGAPGEVVGGVEDFPAMWLAFGEGTEVFQLEVVADGQRGRYADNRGELPERGEIEEGGPRRVEHPMELGWLAEELTEKGFPTVVSREAGNYLCEEMLYVLLRRAQREEEGGGARPLVLFCHVPVLGAVFEDGGRVIDAKLLEGFGLALLEALEGVRRPAGEGVGCE